LAPAQIAAGAGAGALAGAVGARKYEDQIAGIVAAPSSVANVGHSAIEAVASAGHGNWGDALTNAGNVGMNATPQMMIMNTVGDKMGQVIGLGMQIKMDHEGKAANPESTLRSPEAADQPVNDAAGAPQIQLLHLRNVLQANMHHVVLRRHRNLLKCAFRSTCPTWVEFLASGLWPTLVISCSDHRVEHDYHNANNRNLQPSHNSKVVACLHSHNRRHRCWHHSYSKISKGN